MSILPVHDEGHFMSLVIKCVSCFSDTKGAEVCRRTISWLRRCTTVRKAIIICVCLTVSARFCCTVWLMWIVYHQNARSCPQAREAKIGEKQSRQSNSKYNCVQCDSKKLYAVYNGVWGKAPEAGEFPRIFALKVTIQVSYNY